ncbi:synapse-associated protein 1-like isoform X4 [Durio zibethinus]|uniref:Synapse-associated protein 1-like isoform X4 n=1 Tax=Durio zibethinus TaxID=66656 RepID=A0A6P6AXB4_DURZI|nr:synapse-associated protein 1-like isoform X4 [Durio zibethinus]
MDIWNKARNFAEEAAKRSSELTKEAARRSSDLTIGSTKLVDIVNEAAKRSKEIAVEASKRADQIRAEATRRTGLFKSSLAEGIAPPQNTETQVEQEKELERFGINEELRDFVKGITLSTFQDFPFPDDSPMSDVPIVSNEISKLRYELCPRVMKERKFWRIYFILVNSHVAPYEKRYTEDIEQKSVEQVIDEKVKESSNVEMTSNSQAKETKQHSKYSTSSTEQDLDAFLLGGDSDEGPDDTDEVFDDDFDKMVDSSDDEKDKS